jgi:hypothetical protein
MCEQQFQAEVMDELKQEETYIGCVYCGEPKGERLSCCEKNHFLEMSYE